MERMTLKYIEYYFYERIHYITEYFDAFSIEV